jgi:glycosyltransferase involved in cell wall biosynthesis
MPKMHCAPYVQSRGACSANTGDRVRLAAAGTYRKDSQGLDTPGTVDSAPQITTIIPTYRRPKLLQRAIRSVLNQTYTHFRVCIYDNASGDETAEVVADLASRDPRIKYYCHPRNIGAIGNFNYGMSRVETPFFSFLSDDDVLLPDFYEHTLEGFDQYPSAIFSAGSVISMTQNGEVLGSQLLSWSREGYYTSPEGLFTMLGTRHPTWTGILFRREVIHEIGVLDEDVGPLADMDFELRIAALFSFVISRNPCAIFVRHPLSSCSSTDLRFFWPGWLKIIHNLKNDERIPLDVRLYVEQELTDELKRSLLGTGFILRKEFGDAHRAAGILRYHFNQKKEATILHVTTRLCENFPPVYFLLVFRDRLRVMLNRIKSRNLQKQFGHYAKFLNVDNEVR